VDFFGVVQVGYNFGGISRVGREHEYLDARAQELRTARYELESRIQRFRLELHATGAQTTRELALLDRDAAALATARAALSRSEATNAQPALDALEVALTGVECERVFLTQLLSEVRRLEEK
jgi:hypothetical protein